MALVAETPYSDMDLSYSLDPSPEALFTSKNFQIQATKEMMEKAGKAIISAGSLFPVSGPSKKARAIAEEPPYNIKIYEDMYVKIELLHEIVNTMAVWLFHSGMQIKPAAHVRSQDDFDVSKVSGLKENIIFIQQWSRYIGLNSVGIDVIKTLLWSGNSYIEVVFDPSSDWKITHLKQIKPAEMRVIRDEFGEILGYLQFPYKSGLLSSLSVDKARRLRDKFPNDAIFFAPDDIIHLKWDALPGGAYGISLFESIKDIIAIVVGMREDMGIIVRNHAAPTVLFRIGTDLIPATDDTIASFGSYLDNNFDNTTSLVASTLVQPPDVIDTSSKIIDLPKYLQMALSILFAGVGLPEIMFGQGSETTEATAKQQIYAVEKKFKAMEQIFKDAFELKVLSKLCKQVQIVPMGRGENITYKVILRPKDMDIVPEFYFPPLEDGEQKRLRLEKGVELGALPFEAYRVQFGFNPTLKGTFVIKEDRDFQMQLAKESKPPATLGTGTKKDGKSQSKKSGGSLKKPTNTKK